MKIADILKRNIPEFQRGSKPLSEYLDAAGEFLDDAKEVIENFDHMYDYKDGSGFNIEQTILDRGYNVPSRISEDQKRRVLRDASELFLKNGTMDALEHAIRLAGLKPDIRVAWLPSPTDARRGFLTDPETRYERRFNIDRFIYTEMLYGAPRATEDGVFFYGHRYTDVFKEEEIGPLPILGERYKDVPENPVAVSSTPYVVIRFDEGDSTIVTDPVYDPDTGELYEYSTSEAFDLISEVLQILMKETMRPTTLRIVIIMYFMPFTDELSFDIEDTSMNENWINHDPGDPDENISVEEEFGFEVTFDPSLIRIGMHGHIGEEVTPLMSRFTIFRGLKIGDTSGKYTELTSTGLLTGTSHIPGGQSAFDYPLRGVCSFVIKLPAGQGATIRGYKGDDPSNSVQLLRMNPSPNQATEASVTPPLEYDVMRIVIDNPALTATVDYTYQPINYD